MSVEALVTAVQAAADASPRRPLPPTVGKTADITPAAVAGLVAALEAEPALGGIWGKILVLPGQSSLISADSAAIYLTERVRSGLPARLVIDSLLEFAATGQVDYVSVTALSNIRIEGRVEIGEGAYLDLPQTLPPGVPRNVAFHIGLSEGAVAPGEVALLIEKRLPVLADPPPPPLPGQIPQPFSSGLERHHPFAGLRARAHLAIIAGGGVSPRYGASYGFVRCPGLPIADELGVGGSWVVPPPPATLSSDRSEAMRQIWSAPGDTPPLVARAGQHLRRSRGREAPEERAIDLGACLEMLLMKGDSTGNTEITNKISHRAAWLLGRDGPERKAIFDTVRAIYNLRSKAVHEGEFKPLKSPEQYAEGEQLFADAERLCGRLITRLLSGWPDWTDLTLQLSASSDA